MATTFLFVLLVSVLYQAVVSLPVKSISQDKSLVELPTSVDVDTTKKVVFNAVAILSRSAETEEFKSLDTVDRALSRSKRQVIDGQHSCADGMVWFWNMCITREKYKQLTDDYDEEI